MTREQYEEILNTDPKEINLTDEDIKDWIDGVADAQLAADHNCYDLDYGKCVDGCYEHSVSTCCVDPIVHIYQGLDILARVVGKNISVEKIKYSDGTIGFRHSFMYRNLKFFQLSDSESELVRK